MKIKMKPVVAACALALASNSALALTDVYLIAKSFTKTLPDGTTVEMWGYAEDVGGACYNAGSQTQRFNSPLCQDPEASVPGPRISLPAGDPEVRLLLTNMLPVPTSIIIAGQELPSRSATGRGPTWNDGSVGSRTGLTQKMRSYDREAASEGGSLQYEWRTSANGINNEFMPGSFVYHSGTVPQNQVYMGLYGAITQNAVDATGTTPAEVYPGVSYDNEEILFYSELDLAHNAAVAAGDASYTPIEYHPSWFLINGEPFVKDGPNATDDLPIGGVGDKTLLRFLSAAGEKHVAVLQGLTATIHAEDGIQYTWQDGATGGETIVSRQQYSVGIAPLKSKDVIIQPPAEGRYAVYDGNGYMTNPSNPDDPNDGGDTVGGMLRFLEVAASTSNNPPVANDDTASVVENPTTADNSVVIDVLANDSDLDVGDTLTITSVTNGSLGTATHDGASVTYTPSIGAGAGSDSLTYEISDGNGGTATASVAVTVDAANSAPTITTAAVTTATTSQAYAYDVDATDADAGDTLTFSLGVAPAGMSIDSVTGLISWTPTVQQDGPNGASVTVTDSLGATDTQPFVVDVTLANNAPTISSTANTSATADQAYAYDVDAADIDLGDTQTFSLQSAPAGMTIDAGTGVIDWTPSLAQLGSHAVTVRVTDFHGLFGEQSFNVEVTSQNGTLFFSTVGGGNNNSVPGVAAPYDDADIYDFNGTDYGRQFDATVNGIPGNVNIDALHRVDADTFYVSFTNNTPVTLGGIDFDDEDVALYDAGNWSLYFDGSVSCSLDNSNGQDLDAISIDGGILYFSTTGGGNANAVAGVAGPYDDADIYTWNGTSCGRAFDASANGLPGNADIDGLAVRGGTYYMSFNRNGGTNVPDVGTVQDEAVVMYNASWSIYFDGTGLSATNGRDVDAIDVP